MSAAATTAVWPDEPLPSSLAGLSLTTFMTMETASLVASNSDGVIVHPSILPEIDLSVVHSRSDLTLTPTTTTITTAIVTSDGSGLTTSTALLVLVGQQVVGSSAALAALASLATGTPRPTTASSVIAASSSARTAPPAPTATEVPTSDNGSPLSTSRPVAIILPLVVLILIGGILGWCTVLHRLGGIAVNNWFTRGERKAAAVRARYQAKLAAMTGHSSVLGSQRRARARRDVEDVPDVPELPAEDIRRSDEGQERVREVPRGESREIYEQVEDHG